MARGMRSDLSQRFAEAELEKHFVTALSESDARRLRAGVARGELVSPATGVWARAQHWQTLKPPQRAMHVIRTLAILHPSWVFCSFSAALAHGLCVPHAFIGTTHVATKRVSRVRNSRGIVRHVLDTSDYQEVNGIKVTPLDRTVFDCLRKCNFRFGLAIADSALREGSLSQNELISSFERTSGRFPHRQQALDTMELADVRAESGGESVARAVMIERGFRMPELQHIVTDPISGSKKRVDFYWEQSGWPNVIGELDGKIKYADPDMTRGKSVLQVLTDERLRESRISFSDARIVRFSYGQATNAEFLTILLSAFGVPRDADIPDVATDAHDREAHLTRFDRLALSRLIEYAASTGERVA